MTLEELRTRLSTYNISALSRELDIPYHVLNKIANGNSTRPDIDVYLKIVAYLEGK